MWSNISLAVYIGAALALAAALAAQLGLGTYDAAAGTFDLGPVSISTVSAWLAGIIAAIVAAVRNLGGWGRRK